MTARAEHFEIAVESQGESTVLLLSGELDPHTAPTLQSQIDELSQNGCTELSLDLKDLRFIDSSGLRVIVLAQRLMDERQGHFALRHPSTTAKRLFEIAGLVDHIEIIE